MAQASRLKDVPVWAFAGGVDRAGVTEAVKAMVEAMRQCGGNAKLTVYPEHAHDVWDLAYDDPQLYEWLLGQRRGRPAKQGAE